MRYLYTGDAKYHGTCRPIDEQGNACHNQFYWLITNRIRSANEPKLFFERRVLSIGFIWRGYGRVFDIPLSKWGLVEI